MGVFPSHNSCHILKAALVNNLHDWLLYAFFLAQHTAQHRTMPTPCQRIFLHSSSRYSMRLRLRILFHEAKSKFLICQLYGCNQYGRCVCVCVIGIYESIPCTAIKYKNLFKPLEFFIIIVRNIRASHTFPTTEYKSHIFSTSRVFFASFRLY